MAAERWLLGVKPSWQSKFCFKGLTVIAELYGIDLMYRGADVKRSNVSPPHQCTPPNSAPPAPTSSRPRS